MIFFIDCIDLNTSLEESTDFVCCLLLLWLWCGMHLWDCWMLEAGRVERFLVDGLRLLFSVGCC